MKFPYRGLVAASGTTLLFGGPAAAVWLPPLADRTFLAVADMLVLKAPIVMMMLGAAMVLIAFLKPTAVRSLSDKVIVFDSFDDDVWSVPTRAADRLDAPEQSRDPVIRIAP